MISDERARDAALVAWASVTGGDTNPPKNVVTCLLAIARFESSYGDIKGQETNNWGAVQCSHPPPCKEGECIELQDSHQGGEKYKWCYRTFPTPEAGATFLLSLLKKRGLIETMAAGDVGMLARKMYLTGYYGGVSKWGKKGVPNPKQPVEHQEKVVNEYAAALYRNAVTISKNLGELLIISNTPQSFGVGSKGLGLLLIGGAIAAYLATRRRK